MKDELGLVAGEHFDENDIQMIALGLDPVRAQPLAVFFLNLSTVDFDQVGILWRKAKHSMENKALIGLPLDAQAFADMFAGRVSIEGRPVLLFSNHQRFGFKQIAGFLSVGRDLGGSGSSKSELRLTTTIQPVQDARKVIKPRNQQFDVFLSHNSRNKPLVRQLGEALKARGLRVWLDEWELVPGRPWQEALEEIILTAKSAAVLVGKDGLGPWEVPEMRGCLSEFVNRRSPVIPVLLPEASKQPDLPLFLKLFTWVDLSGGLTKEGLDRLEWGITGKKP